MLFPIIVVLETIITSLFVITSAEYLLTEQFMVIRYLTTPVKTEIFLILLAVLFALNYFWPEFRKFGKKTLPILGLILLGCLFGYKKYRAYYSRLQRKPKIFSISSDWSIQAKRIIIEGKNFGWAHDDSAVIAGGEEFLVDSWNPNRIVVSAPLTGKFGQHELYIKLQNGEMSRRMRFKFVDPIELSWKK